MNKRIRNLGAALYAAAAVSAAAYVIPLAEPGTSRTETRKRLTSAGKLVTTPASRSPAPAPGRRLTSAGKLAPTPAIRNPAPSPRLRLPLDRVPHPRFREIARVLRGAELAAWVAIRRGEDPRPAFRRSLPDLDEVNRQPEIFRLDVIRNGLDHRFYRRGPRASERCARKLFGKSDGKDDPYRETLDALRMAEVYAEVPYPWISTPAFDDPENQARTAKAKRYLDHAEEMLARLDPAPEKAWRFSEPELRFTFHYLHCWNLLRRGSPWQAEAHRQDAEALIPELPGGKHFPAVLLWRARREVLVQQGHEMSAEYDHTADGLPRRAGVVPPMTATELGRDSRVQTWSSWAPLAHFRLVKTEVFLAVNGLTAPAIPRPVPTRPVVARPVARLDPAPQGIFGVTTSVPRFATP